MKRIAILVVSFFVLVALCGKDVSFSGAPWLFLGVLSIASCAFVGRYKIEGDHSLGEIGRPMVAASGGVALFIVGLKAAVHGLVAPFFGSAIVWAGAMTASVSVLVATSLRASPVRGLVRDSRIWALGLVFAVVLAGLGSFGLTDPWETHYAEVAREMLARQDWISTFWANEGWFHSKPVLTFWFEAASMALLGVDATPGHVLQSAPHVEWAIRLPQAICALAGTLFLSLGIAAHHGRRAGILASCVLVTCPMWILLSRQATTDMNFLGPLSAAMGCLLLAWAPRSATAPTSWSATVHRLRVSVELRELVFAFFLFCTFPQIAYLASRNVTLVPHLSIHRDLFVFGSAGVCGKLPGQADCITQVPALVRFPPILIAFVLAWAVAWIGMEILNTKSRDSSFKHLAFLFVGLGIAAKGPAAFVLPLGVIAVECVSKRRWPNFLAIGLGVGIAACIVVPWYLATYSRHGRLFWDELVMRHMIGRTLEHLHDTNELEDVGAPYYLSQLGYGLFPWVMAIPFAFFRLPRAKGAVLALTVWAASSFVLFSMMSTKFHHYIAPAVPPIAGLLAIGLSEHVKSKERSSHYGTWFVGTVMLVGVLADFFFADARVSGVSKFISLVSYRYERTWPALLRPEKTIVILTVIAVASFCVYAWRRWVLAPVLAASAFALFLSHRYLPAVAAHWGQRPSMMAYTRRNAVEPLVAYQLNWKGENFYTGNRVALFIHSEAPFIRYMNSRKGAGVHEVFVALERDRFHSLRAELSGIGAVEWVTNAEESNRFGLAVVRFL